MKSIVFAIMGLFVLFSCNKNKNESGANNNLVGDWELTAMGRDSNSNGLLDPNEELFLGSTEKKVFFSNNTGIDSSEDSPGIFLPMQNFRWQYDEANANIEFVLVEVTGEETFRYTAKVHTLNSMQLIYSAPATDDTVNHYQFFRIYKKL